PYAPSPQPETRVTPTMRTLPRAVREFTGRNTELQRLLSAARTAAEGPVRTIAIHAVDGMPGVGKTAFAVHAAHQLADVFPDGQIFLELHGHTHGQDPVTAHDALASLLLAAGITADQVPARIDDRARLWRDRVGDKKVLLILDDAVDAAQVNPLIPNTPSCLVLVTSRRRLTALTDAEPVSLDVLPPDQAVDMFRRHARSRLLPPDDDEIREITALCGGLPLAISMAAGRLVSHPTWTLRYMVDRLTAKHRGLADEYPDDVAVAAAFSLSYRDLPSDQQRLFRRLGLHPGPDIDAHAAAALDGSDPATSRLRLEALYLGHLVDEPQPGRYRLHSLIHAYTEVLLTEEPPRERDRARARLLDHYHCTAAHAATFMPGDCSGHPRHGHDAIACTDDALRWLHAERVNLLACAGYAAEHDLPQYAVGLSTALHAFLRLSGRWDQARTLHTAALRVLGPSQNRRNEALIRKNLGAIHYLLDSYTDSIASLESAHTLYRSLENLRGQAAVLSELGHVHRLTENHRDAARYLTQAHAIYETLHEPLGQAIALNELGVVHYRTHDYPAATRALRTAFTLFTRQRDRRGQANVLNVVATLRHAIGMYTPAARAARWAQKLYIALGDPRGHAITLNILGAIACSHGHGDTAVDHHIEALRLYETVGSRSCQGISLNYLGRALHQHGDHEQAMTMLRRAYQLSLELQNRTEQAVALNNLGNLARTWPHAGNPLSLHKEALATARDAGAQLEEARALEGIARCLLPRHHKRATTCLRRALDIYRRLKAPQATEIQRLLTRAQRLHPIATMHPDQVPPGT
uniref:ATP-binding protein n=1 Tax=Amycolatopsis circi TaxID=871959 RepID=UPI001ABF42D9